MKKQTILFLLVSFLIPGQRTSASGAIRDEALATVGVVFALETIGCLCKTVRQAATPSDGYEVVAAQHGCCKTGIFTEELLKAAQESFPKKSSVLVAMQQFLKEAQKPSNTTSLVVRPDGSIGVSTDPSTATFDGGINLIAAVVQELFPKTSQRLGSFLGTYGGALMPAGWAPDPAVSALTPAQTATLFTLRLLQFAKDGIATTSNNGDGTATLTNSTGASFIINTANIQTSILAVNASSQRDVISPFLEGLSTGTTSYVPYNKAFEGAAALSSTAFLTGVVASSVVR